MPGIDAKGGEEDSILGEDTGVDRWRSLWEKEGAVRGGTAALGREYLLDKEGGIIWGVGTIRPEGGVEGGAMGVFMKELLGVGGGMTDDLGCTVEAGVKEGR